MLEVTVDVSNSTDIAATAASLAESLQAEADELTDVVSATNDETCGCVHEMTIDYDLEMGRLTGHSLPTSHLGLPHAQYQTFK